MRRACERVDKMTVRNIAVSVARLLQADDIEEMLLRADDGEDAPATQDTDVSLLVACVNSALRDIAADGFPITRTERARADGGVIPLSALSRAPSSVRRIAGACGEVTFEPTDIGIEVPQDGEYAVTYTAEPTDAGLDDEAELGALCDRSMLAYMTARNYCLIAGRSDEASVWDQMYDAHAARKRLTRRARLPKRKW